MTSFRIRVPWLLLTPLTLLTTYADVTVRYQTEFQMNPALPASMTSAMTSNVPKDSILRFKDGKGYSASAGMDMITDFTTKEITLIDGAGKRYAKMTSEQYGQEFERAMPVIPPQARTAAASMKTESTPARMTGRTAVIQGVEAEEREFAISTQMPGPPNSQPGPTMKIVLQIWKAKPKGTTASRLIRAREASLGLVASLGFLLMVSLVVSTALTAFGNYLDSLIPFGKIILTILNVIVSLVLISFLFAAIYKVLPDRSLEWGDVAIGAVVTGILFTVGKSLISWYIGSSAVASSFGAAGGLIVLLLWVYYSAQIFLLGAEFTKNYAKTHGSMQAEG